MHARARELEQPRLTAVSTTVEIDFRHAPANSIAIVNEEGWCCDNAWREAVTSTCETEATLDPDATIGSDEHWNLQS